MNRSFVSRRGFLAAGGASLLGGCVESVDSESSPVVPENYRAGEATATASTTRPPDTATPTPPASTTAWDTGLGESVEWFVGAGRWSGTGETRVTLDDGAGTDGSPEPYRGEHSLRIEGTGRVQADGDFSDAPLDLRDRSVSLAVYPDRPGIIGALYTIVHAPDADNWIRFETAYLGGRDLDWVRGDCHVDAVAGDPDLSDVRRVRLRTVTGLDDEPHRLWIDDLRTLPRPDRGKVMVMFDDIRESQYPNAFPSMRKYDVPAAFGVIVGLVGPSTTLEELHEMERAGSELVSHSMTAHTMTEIAPDRRREYLRESKRWLREHALKPEAADHFVFPESAYDEAALADVREVYDYSYVAAGPSSAGVTDPYTVARVGWDAPSIDEHERLLERTAEYGDLLVPVLHSVTGDDVAKFERYCELLDGMRDRIDLITPTEFASLQGELASA